MKITDGKKYTFSMDAPECQVCQYYDEPITNTAAQQSTQPIAADVMIKHDYRDIKIGENTMKVKCRGYSGELLHLETDRTMRNKNREPVTIYFIRLSPDKNTIIELSDVRENEIEIETGISLKMDASAVAMAINRPFIRGDTDGKPEIDRRCYCAD